MNTFEELNLILPLQKALQSEKYETPTAIQAATIPAALKGRDILGSAQTGTGKTAAFALPILNALGSRNRKAIPNNPFVLILAPTRELAIQIDQSFATYGQHLMLRRSLVYGGVGQNPQVNAMKRGAHILIATPGRLLDLMNQGHISLDRIEILVLDEADRMLDMGFLPDLKRIIQKLPERRQSLFFSATLPPAIIQLSQELLTDPVHVDVTPEVKSVELIDQKVLYLTKQTKAAMLTEILRGDGVGQAVIFTKTKRTANLVATQLCRDGFQATAIHGNKSQNARQRTLTEFRAGKVDFLVATDLAARGLDIDGITHVINYDLPIEPENYLHRIGRTGRAGAAGSAITFCIPEERGLLRTIEKLIGQRIPQDPNHAPAEGERPARSFEKPRGQKKPGSRKQHPFRDRIAAHQSATHQEHAPAQPPASPVASSEQGERPRRHKQRPRHNQAQTVTPHHEQTKPTGKPKRQRPRRKPGASRRDG